MIRWSRSALLAGAVALSPAAVIAQDGEAATERRSTTHGVFTDVQAERGKEVMWGLCSECHVDEDFQGGFLRSWAGATVRSLFEEIVATMPEDSPSSLEAGEYVDVIAYMFKLNGLPAGEQEMGTAKEALDGILIELPESSGR